MSLAFGIPTIKREKTSYLLDTLASLLDGMTQEDKDDSVIVVFVGEVNNLMSIKLAFDKSIIYKAKGLLSSIDLFIG